MKVWYDCEFLDDGATIDLVSIGMVAEDGRELYLQSIEYDPAKANEWVKANVFPHLRQCPDINQFHDWAYHNTLDGPCSEKGCPWRNRAQIAQEVKAFLRPSTGKVELWGYYSSFDHVALCQLFGPMIEMRKHGLPMFTHDLKQWCDGIGNPKLPVQDEGKEHNALEDARWNKRLHEFLSGVTMRMMQGEGMQAGLQRID